MAAAPGLDAALTVGSGELRGVRVRAGGWLLAVWVLLGVVGLAALMFAQDHVFPSVDVDIRMTRAEAL